MPIDHIHALPPGTRFEEYRLDTVLGTGGFGITYRAYDAHLDKFVAIKEYLPVEFATRTEASTVVPHSNADAQDYHWGLTRFLDEARTLARFDHPHLNKVYRFFESNGTAYMVLEYIHGETLADRLSKEPYLEEAALQRLLDEVLSGLEVMHEAGYVHRDIKPGNLMLREEDGSAVVLDFGAARQAVGQRSKAITSILTPGYAPVEQYDGKVDRVGPWTDIYALGMVAYRCISGMGDSELPDAVARMLAHTRGEEVLLPAVEAGKGKYSSKLLEAIDWAMEVDEESRPQGVAAWRQALAGGGRRKSPPKSVRKATTRPTRGTTTERPGSRWSGMALTLVIVSLLGAGAWWAWQTYPELFGQDPGDPPEVVQQEEPINVPGETSREVETGETREVVAGTGETPPPKPDETEQPVSKEPALSAEEAEVARLLAAAEADLKARRLTSPAGNNAWEKFQRILELVPAHPEAMAGVERVMESYLELFGAAVEQEDLDKASEYLARISEFHPDSPVLETGERRIETASQARAARLAEIKRQRQADEAARQAELERQRIEQAIQEKLAVFETALEAEDLDEAADILTQVRDLNPEEPRLAAGEQRLEAARTEMEQQQTEQAIKEHWSAFEAALDEEDFEAAANSLTQIRGLDPDASGLTGARQRLSVLEAAAAKVRQYAGKMVSVPSGSFRMGDLGSLEYGFESEWPVHGVAVSAFKLGKYEVTFAQWDACVADGGCDGYRPDDEGWGRGNRPVINISWDNAQTFIDWLSSKTGDNFRLPSEAEWEYAVRAGSTTMFHFGNDISQLCQYANHLDDNTNAIFRNDNCSDGVGKRTAEVGQYQPNGYGLYDMHGNVWEWVEDCWNDSYVGAPSDSSAWTSSDCSRRVDRGGSWKFAEGRLRSSDRGGGPHHSSRKNDRGFRLAKDK